MVSAMRLRRAASGSSPLGGAALLAVYSLGLAVPFILSGLFFAKAIGAFSWVKRHFTAIKVVAGSLLIAYGLLMIGGQFTWLAARLARYQIFEF